VLARDVFRLKDILRFVTGFAHSFGVTPSSKAPMVRQVASMVRASALREPGVHFGEGRFGRVEVWRRGGREEELGFGRSDGGANGAALMAAEVVHDDDVAWP